MPSVLFWSGMPGGTAEYRCFVPGRALARRGWEVAYDEEGIDVSLDGRVKGDPDVLVLCRVMGDYVPDAVRRIRQANRTLVVFDVDDWFGGVPDFNPASKVPAEIVGTMHRAMRESHLVTCSTPELAEAYARLNRTVVLPNYLDPDIWADRWPPRVDSHIVVGWAGAFHWRAGDLELLRSWVPRFLDDHPEVRFGAIGCSELLEWLGISGNTTPRLPMGPNTHERNLDLHPYQHLPAMLVNNLDIGLVPLLPMRFNNAKSWCKGMEYNAMGIPAIASPSREYQRFIQPGVNGYLVRKNDWRGTVERALDNLDALRVGAKQVASEYFIDQHIERWEQAYASRGSLVHQ